jgi:hypothetical protein
MPIVWPWKTGSCGLTATVVGIAERPLLRVADLKDMARPSETWLWMEDESLESRGFSIRAESNW